MYGAEIWHRILNAIERLQAQKPDEDEAVHEVEGIDSERQLETEWYLEAEHAAAVFDTD
jgi:hypothetical protein